VKGPEDIHGGTPSGQRTGGDGALSGWDRGAFAELAAERPFGGVERRGFDSQRASVVEYSFERGASFPVHRHPEEQILVVERGSLTLFVAGAWQELRSGEWAVIEPAVEHGITAGGSGARFLTVLVPKRRSSHDYELLSPRGGG
jgi:quercetin dioxygenase-like cupin family protein